VSEAGLRVVAAAEVERLLDDRALIERLAAMFRSGCEVPLRHHHHVATPAGSGGTLLLMPAWQPGRHLGIKSVTVFPDNAARSLPTVSGLYLLLDGTSGMPLAVIDGVSLTLRRTAAASALAARYLARADAARLLMVGAGALAPHLIRAHAAVRPIRQVALWNRTRAHAEALATKLAGDFDVAVADDLEAAVRTADVISCATLSRVPLLRGAWLKPGSHLDLVGGFTPEMREADDEAVRRARLFVDTRAGATREAGDIAEPLARGVIAEADIQADLFALSSGAHAGRTAADEITLFKSVGTALEDLAAAALVHERLAS
jgi:ornithine cyclodeaminase